jgi:hypothetical protein
MGRPEMVVKGFSPRASSTIGFALFSVSVLAILGVS